MVIARLPALSTKGCKVRQIDGSVPAYRCNHSRHNPRSGLFWPLALIAADLSQNGFGCPSTEERDATEGDARKGGDSEWCQPWPEPQLEHRHVVTGASLEDPQGATLGGEKGHAFSDQHHGRDPKPAIASSSDGAIPEIAETGELSNRDRVMEHPQDAGLAA